MIGMAHLDRLVVLGSFGLQTARMPFLMFLFGDSDVLDNYFIVTSSAIALQFYATEVLLYRGVGQNDPRSKSLDSFVFATIFLIGFFLLIKFGLLVLLSYVLFSLSLLAYSFFQYCNREIKGARSYLLWDFFLNICLILSALLVLEVEAKFVSYYLLTLVAAVYFSVALCIFGVTLNFKTVAAQEYSERRQFHPYLFQCGVMLITQLERLIISTISPNFLAYIAIAGALALGVRRIALDDAVLFSRLTTYAISIVDVVQSGFHIHWLYTASCVFVTSCILLGSHFIGITLFMDTPMIRETYIVLVLYLLTAPFAIIQINVVRAGLVVPGAGTFWFMGVLVFLYSVICLLAIFGVPTFPAEWTVLLVVISCLFYVVASFGTFKALRVISIARWYHLVSLALLTFGVLIYKEL